MVRRVAKVWKASEYPDYRFEAVQNHLQRMGRLFLDPSGGKNEKIEENRK